MRRRAKPRDAARRRGAILVLVAVLMPVFALMAAFAVDVAWMQLVRTELRTATDASARAGAKHLSLGQTVEGARLAAIDAASQNAVAGVGLRVGPAQVHFGSSTPDPRSGRFTFLDGGAPINAVHVDGLRTAGSPAGPVNLFFGRLLAVNVYQPTSQATSTVLDRDLCLVIDRSGSMGLPLSFPGDGVGQLCGPMARNTRFFALAESIDAFLTELRGTLPAERVALASYSSAFVLPCLTPSIFDVADVRAPLTADYTAIEAEMDRFVQNGIGGFTAIGEGLRKGIEAVNGPGSRPLALKTVVLMTDGLHNTGVSPVVVARQAVDRDITVHTITFSAAADQRRMRQVAELTGGKHFHADTAADLREAFREIARTLPVLLTE